MTTVAGPANQMIRSRNRTRYAVYKATHERDCHCRDLPIELEPLVNPDTGQPIAGLPRTLTGLNDLDGELPTCALYLLSFPLSVLEKRDKV